MAYEGNRYAGLNRKGPQDKAGWLGAAGTVAGAGLGLLAGPGGMAAGAKLGGALGGVTHDAVNGTLTPMSVAGDVMQGVSGFKGLNGAMDNKSILEAFMRDPHSFRVPAFANGGLVTGQGMDMASQWAQMDPVQRAMLQAQQAVGPAPTAPTPQPLQQAQHPTLEALSSLLPQIMAAMPRPANPRNTKAIGAWLPAAGLALSAPAAVAQSRRASANAPIEQANTTARSDYEAKRKAYEERKTKISDTAFGNATKPFADKASDATISLDMAKQLGHPEWAGLTESQARLKMQGAPTPVKPEGPPSPKDRAGIANMILDNVRQDKDVSNFVTVRDNYTRIARMAQNGSGVGDMSLIFAYMKVLDPTSVVRESEYKNAADAIGKIPQLANLPANWMVGSKLTPVGRAGFVQAAKDLYEAQRTAYRAAIEMHKGFAQEYGIDPRLILRNYEALDSGVPEVNAKPPAGPSPPADTGAGRRRQ